MFHTMQKDVHSNLIAAVIRLDSDMSKSEFPVFSCSFHFPFTSSSCLLGSRNLQSYAWIQSGVLCTTLKGIRPRSAINLIGHCGVRMARHTFNGRFLRIWRFAAPGLHLNFDFKLSEVIWLVMLSKIWLL